jgi:hypothetical protein
MRQGLGCFPICDGGCLNEEIWQAEEMQQAGNRALAFAQTKLLLGSRSCIRPEDSFGA